jgi:hypothetical protein
MYHEQEKFGIVLGGASKLVLSTKYNSNEQVREDEVDWACISYGREKGCIEGCGRKDRREEPLRRPKSRWEDNIEMHLRYTGWDDMD